MFSLIGVKKFQYDRLRNDKALGNRKSDNNKKQRSFPGPKKLSFIQTKLGELMPSDSDPRVFHTYLITSSINVRLIKLRSIIQPVFGVYTRV